MMETYTERVFTRMTDKNPLYIVKRWRRGEMRYIVENGSKTREGVKRRKLMRIWKLAPERPAWEK